MIKKAADIYHSLLELLGEIDFTDVWLFPGMQWPIWVDRRWFEDEAP
jgi:hypothetical protein